MLNHGLIWFGAAISISEILTGALIAPLGMGKGAVAILLGHLIGGIIFYLVGLIGARTGKNSMESVKLSFGKKGALFFSGLNILQLIGWTAVMIATGASVSNSIIKFESDLVWGGIIALLIIVWIVKDIKKMNKLNLFAMITLFILTLLLSKIIFSGTPKEILKSGITFGGAMELSIAMPLSWLPLISDYIWDAKKPKKAVLVSSIVYFLSSSWMYFIGMGVVIYTGSMDIAEIMKTAGFGIGGLLIIILSTVTTTFLDTYSSGVSATVISSKITEKQGGVATCIIAVILLMFTSTTQYESFLYLIGSVFAPMVAIQIADHFILKNDYTKNNLSSINIGIWIVGFILYRLFMEIETPIGNTVPVMVIILILTVIINKIFRKEIGGVKNENN